MRNNISNLIQAETVLATYQQVLIHYIQWLANMKKAESFNFLIQSGTLPTLNNSTSIFAAVDIPITLNYLVPYLQHCRTALNFVTDATAHNLLGRTAYAKMTSKMPTFNILIEAYNLEDPNAQRITATFSFGFGFTITELCEESRRVFEAQKQLMTLLHETSAFQTRQVLRDIAESDCSTLLSK